MSLVVGTVGGIYGTGGGSIPASDPAAVGYSAYEVAPATLVATFLTSIGGIVTYRVLQTTHAGAITPDSGAGPIHVPLQARMACEHGAVGSRGRRRYSTCSSWAKLSSSRCTLARCPAARRASMSSCVWSYAHSRA